ncbi:MAG TPA: lytic transglycosylase domain-containing protein [Symbiobacteriaceae bacterium]|nr:lytic transglycosylase domain-containing protein [Symbiobacteriaceae bacterium]
MMWHQEIESVANRFTLPVGLIHAIVQVESSGNPWAARYEPGFKTLYLDNRTWRVYGPVSMDTEIVSRATSWGLMQIMGQVARERGCEMAFLNELCRPEAGLEYGCRQLKFLEGRYFDGNDWNPVISAYNQGSPRRNGDGTYKNQGYVDKVRHFWA